MNNNLKHIDDLFLTENLLKDKNNLNNWLKSASVSSKSKFIDDIWYFDTSEIYHKSQNTINWNKKTSSGKNLKDYPFLFESIKKTIFFMQTTLETRERKKFLSQMETYSRFLNLADWMICNNLYKFSDLTQTKTNQYINWLKLEKFKGKYTDKNLSTYIYPIQHLVKYNEYLIENVNNDLMNLLNGSVARLIGVKRSTETKVKAIPNEVLEKICNKILPTINYFYENKFDFNKVDEYLMFLNKEFHTKNGKSYNLNKDSKASFVIKTLNTIGYFIIGLYTGMRVSEILSIKKNCLEVDENNVLVINSTLFKFVGNNEGRPEKWGCGINNENNYALKIINILSSISPKENDSLFFIYHSKKFKPMMLFHCNKFLNELLRFYDIDWDITTHQLRKTFAKLIGITDKTNLLALKEHFKHASLTMTDYYVGTNFELLGMISEEKQLELTENLETILQTDKLAGKLGEKISNVNLKFRGNVEERKNYISEILNNSDLIVVPHEYGFCIYQPEQAKCKGNNQNIGLNTCTKCNNFVVSEKHKLFWLKKLEQNTEFKKEILDLKNQELTIQELDFEIEEAKNILNKITKNH